MHMLPALNPAKKLEPDPFRLSSLSAQQPRRLPDAAFSPLRPALPTMPEQALKKPSLLLEEEEEEEEQDEAAKAFLATCIAPTLSQLELRTLLKVRTNSASAFRLMCTISAITSLRVV